MQAAFVNLKTIDLESFTGFFMNSIDGSIMFWFFFIDLNYIVICQTHCEKCDVLNEEFTTFTLFEVNTSKIILWCDINSHRHGHVQNTHKCVDTQHKTHLFIFVKLHVVRFLLNPPWKYFILHVRYKYFKL